MKSYGNWDSKAIADSYKKSFDQYGDSPKSMHWWSDRANIRYSRLLRFLNIEEGRILDIGCGLGNLNEYIRLAYKIPNTYRYLGVDFLPDFIEKAKEKYPWDGVKFICGDLDQPQIYESIKEWNPVWGVASGIFNSPSHSGANECYDFMLSTMQRCFSLCQKGVSFNFVTDRVDFKREDMAYHSPIKVLEWAYSLTKNVILDNSYMPFEATITLFKDDSFNETMCFNKFIKEHQKQFENGLYIVEKGTYNF